jgi:hypothetical protein
VTGTRFHGQIQGAATRRGECRLGFLRGLGYDELRLATTC